MKKIIVLFTLLLAMQHHSQAVADNLLSNSEFKVRIGYSIGGTAPIGIPATIRSIDSYKLTPSFIIGIESTKTIYSNWGVLIGFHMENKGMDVEATTKAYRMEVKKGESVLNGLYTGHVRQKVTEWMFTIPIQATYQLSNRVQLKAGPYFSLLLNKDFSGYVYDGYLRQGDPTGPKVSMGTDENERATYDFSDDMRNLQMGIGAGVDWQVHKNIGVSADLNWGINGIFKKDFKTVEQTLYPIYGTISAFYKF